MKNSITKGLLFIGFYPIDKLNGAAKVRIWNISKCLNPQYSIIGFFKKRINGYYYLLKDKKFKDIKHVYIEPSASTANPVDLLFLLYLKFRKITIAIFIRDIYPLFKDNWKKLKLYQTPHFFMWFIAVFIYLQITKVRYYPTASARNVLRDKKGKLLPPGCNIGYPVRFNSSSRLILYAGYLNRSYGEDLIIEICKILKKERLPVKIGVVFRGKIDVINRSDLPIEKIGDTLEDFTGSALLGIIPRIVNKYNDIAFPVKLMDYVQMGLPVIVTKCLEISDFVKKNKIGYSHNEKPEEWIKRIKYLLKYPQKAEELHYNVIKTKYRNGWETRANTIIKDYHMIHSNRR